MPFRIISTIVCPPEILMFSSPFPVEPAPPTSPSTYKPAPIIGESPTRPGIFQDSPEVVVVPEISPLSLTARQLMVPDGGSLITSRARAMRASSLPQMSARRARNWSASSGLLLPDAVFPLPSGLSMPGRQLNDVAAFQASHFLREDSVSRFISSK